MSDVPTTVANGGLDRIYDGIEAILPGVLHPLVQLVVWDAIEEFFVQSTHWRELLLWDMPIGTVSLNLNPLDANTRVAWILKLHGLSERSRRIMQPGYIYDLGPGNIVRTGSVWVALKPTKLSAVMPEWLQDWSEGLREGALARLYEQPSKPYTDPARAQYHAKKFRAQIQLARVTAPRLHDVGFPYFARGRVPYGWADDNVSSGAGGGTSGGGGVIIPTGPTLAISPGVISDGVAPIATVGPAVITTITVPAPVITAGATTISFPATAPAGTSATQTLTLTNTGDAPLVITAITTTGEFTKTGETSP